MARIQSQTLAEALQVTIFPENVGFGNMRIITLISIVSWLPISSLSSPFTYKAVEVIFRRIYFYFHLQTAPNLQDCSHSHNLPTFPEFTLPPCRILHPVTKLQMLLLFTLNWAVCVFYIYIYRFIKSKEDRSEQGLWKSTYIHQMKNAFYIKCN